MADVGWPVTGSMAFAAFAAIVQFTFGAILVLRNPRNERVALFGVLFLLNGLLAAVTVLGGGLAAGAAEQLADSQRVRVAVRHTALLLDNATNILLLLLALAYPWRPRWLARAPHMFVVFATLAASLFAIRLVVGSIVFAGRGTGATLSAEVALFTYGAIELAFPLLLLRWAWLWRSPRATPMRAQFALVFAALGVRAVHQILAVHVTMAQDVLQGRPFTVPGLTIVSVIWAANILALAGALLLMARPPRGQGTDASWHWFVVAFLAFGAVEGAMNIFYRANWAFRWWDALTGEFDVLVIRPVLLWFAITRTQLLDVRLQSSGFAWGMGFVLIVASVSGGVFEAFGARGNVAMQWVLSGVIGIAVASVLIAVSQGLMLARSEAWSRPPTPREVYAAHLEEACRNGPLSPADQERLGRLRRRLGIDDTMADEVALQLGTPAAPRRAFA